MNGDAIVLSAGTIKVLLVAVLSMGIWVGTIQADLDSKADKDDVAKDPVEQSEIVSALRNIDDKLGDIKDQVSDLDTRQRVISADVAVLKANAQ